MSSNYDLGRKYNRFNADTSPAGTDLVAVLDVSTQVMKKVTIDDLLDASGIEFKLGDGKTISFGDSEGITIYESSDDFVIKNANAGGNIINWLGDADGTADFQLFNSDNDLLVNIDSLGGIDFTNTREERVGLLDLENYARQPSDVVSITRSGTTATVTTATAHNLTTGESITMAGADQTEYNITATITVTTPTAFTYTVSGTPATPATTVANISYTDNTSGQYMAVFHNYTDGAAIRVDNCGSGAMLQLVAANNDTRRPDKPAGYVGTGDYIQLVDDTTAWFRVFESTREFTQMAGTYKIANNKADDATAAFTVRAYNEHATHTSFVSKYGNLVNLLETATSIGTIASITSSGTTCTVTTSANHWLASGAYVTISGCVETAYNGIFVVTVTGATTFTYTALTTPSASPATGSPAGTASLISYSTPVQKGRGVEIKAFSGDIELDAAAGNLIITGIPTASTGLPSGAVWANSNVLTIIP